MMDPVRIVTCALRTYRVSCWQSHSLAGVEYTAPHSLPFADGVRTVNKIMPNRTDKDKVPAKNNNSGATAKNGSGKDTTDGAEEVSLACNNNSSSTTGAGSVVHSNGSGGTAAAARGGPKSAPPPANLVAKCKLAGAAVPTAPGSAMRKEKRQNSSRFNVSHNRELQKLPALKDAPLAEREDLLIQ
ncbi:hypothetical protein V5799_025138, partial [Amblyomma americanum]